MSSFHLSKHADFRKSQRNITQEELDIVLSYGVDSPAGNSVSKRSLRLSQVEELFNEGFASKIIEKALHTEVIVKNDGTVITCYRMDRKTSILCREKQRQTRRTRRSNVRL